MDITRILRPVSERVIGFRPLKHPRSTALASASATFKIDPKPADFDVSPLILTNTLTPLTKRPAPTDPFVFGMDKPIIILNSGLVDLLDEAAAAARYQLELEYVDVADITANVIIRPIISSAASMESRFPPRNSAISRCADRR